MNEMPPELEKFEEYIPKWIHRMESEIKENSSTFESYKSLVLSWDTSNFLRNVTAYKGIQELTEDWTVNSITLFDIAILSGDFFNTRMFPFDVVKALQGYLDLEEKALEPPEPPNYANFLKETREQLKKWFKQRYFPNIKLRERTSDSDVGEMVFFAPPTLSLVKFYWEEGKGEINLSNLPVTIGDPSNKDVFDSLDFPTKYFLHCSALQNHFIKDALKKDSKKSTKLL